MTDTPLGSMQAFNYTPTDVFWGQLGGCLEALDAGTTMVVDHAHMNYSPQHSKYICLLLAIQLALQLIKKPRHCGSRSFRVIWHSLHIWVFLWLQSTRLCTKLDS